MLMKLTPSFHMLFTKHLLKYTLLHFQKKNYYGGKQFICSFKVIMLQLSKQDLVVNVITSEKQCVIQ